jgi:hypothetical protein
MNPHILALQHIHIKYHEHRNYQMRGFQSPKDTPVNNPEGLNL